MKKVILSAFADEAGEDFDIQLEALCRNTMQGIEIRSVEGENVSKISLEKAKELKKRLDDKGLVCWSIGSPIGKIALDRAAEHREVLRHVAEVAHILGTEKVRMFSYHMKPWETEENENRVIDELKALQEIAASEKLLLCHENEKGIYGFNASNCLKIMQRVPGMKAVFDPANFVQCGVNTLYAWEMLQKHVIYLHAKDAKADGTVVPCGAGWGYVPEIVRQYLALGGEAITLEPHLFSFSALKTLEADPKKRTGYASADEAFDAAASALKAIIA